MPPPHPRTSQSSLPPPQTEGRLLPAQCLEMPASLLRQCLSSRAPSSPRRAGVRSKQDASFLVCLCVCAKWLQPCLILCDPMDCSLLGSSAMGFSRQEYQSGLPCPPPGDLPDPGIELKSFMSPALTGGFFTLAPPGKPQEGITEAMNCILRIQKILNPDNAF